MTVTPDAPSSARSGQRPSGMPAAKYRPFHEQISVELPDRTWPSRRITHAPR